MMLLSLLQVGDGYDMVSVTFALEHSSSTLQQAPVHKNPEKRPSLTFSCVETRAELTLSVVTVYRFSVVLATQASPPSGVLGEVGVGCFRPACSAWALVYAGVTQKEGHTRSVFFFTYRSTAEFFIFSQIKPASFLVTTTAVLL